MTLLSGAANMTTGRYEHVLVKLANGSVLAIGGSTTISNPTTIPTASCEVYNPTTNAWTPTGSMDTPRLDHSAVLLPSGRVLVAGGHMNTPGCSITARPFQNCNPETTLASTEIFDPSTGTWTPGPALPSPREGFSMLLLPTGLVFVTGGGMSTLLGSAGDIPSQSSLLFSEQAGAWSATGTPLMLAPNTFAGQAVLLRV